MNGYEEDIAPLAPTSSQAFRLRKEGHFKAAYDVACAALKASPNDPWNYKAYAWCLQSLLKDAIAKHLPEEEISGWATKLAEIHAEPDDEVLARTVRWAQTYADPDMRARRNATDHLKELEEQQQFSEAREFLEKQPDFWKTDSRMQTRFGWILFRECQQELREEHPAFERLVLNLGLYSDLNLVEKPSKLHSAILSAAVRIHKASASSLDFYRFFSDWNPASLTTEDWEDYVPANGKTVASLAVRAIRQAVKSAAADLTDERAKQLLDWVELGLANKPDDIWLRMDKCRLQIRLGLGQEARRNAIDFVRQKKSEFWAWRILADACREDKDLAFSCLARASLCKIDDAYAITLLEEMAKALLTRGFFKEALYEVNRARKALSNEGYAPKPRLERLAEEISLKAFEEQDPRTTIYPDASSQADGLLSDSLPWTEGWQAGDVRVRTREGKMRHFGFLAFQTETGKFELIKVHAEDFQQAFARPKGTPVRFKKECESGGHITVFRIDCSEGGLWKGYPEQKGFVEYINRDKKVAHLVLEGPVRSFINLSDCPQGIKVGDALSIRMCNSAGKNGQHDRQVVVSAQRADTLPESLLKNFSEFIETAGEDKPFAFTKNHIYIAQELSPAGRINEGDLVRGKAVRSWNNRREEWGWKALQIDGVEHSDDDSAIPIDD